MWIAELFPGPIYYAASISLVAGNFLLVFLSLCAAVGPRPRRPRPARAADALLLGADERRHLHGARRAVLPAASLAQDRARAAPGGGADMSAGVRSRRRVWRTDRWAAPAHRRRRRSSSLLVFAVAVRVRRVDGVARLPLGRRVLPVDERAVRPAQRRPEAGEHRIRLDAAADAAQPAVGGPVPDLAGRRLERRGVRPGERRRAAARRRRSCCSPARQLGLPRWIGWAFALLVSFNPMLFLYAGNGMARGRRRSVPDRRRVLPHAVLAHR